MTTLVNRSGTPLPIPTRQPTPLEGNEVGASSVLDSHEPVATTRPSTPGITDDFSPAPVQRASTVQPAVALDVPFQSQWDQTKNPSTACLRTAKEMAEQRGARDAGSDKALWLNASEVTRQSTPQQLRSYMDGQLNAGKPVIAGVDRPGGSNSNQDKVTDHWVVVTGRGQDEQGRTYYSFHDPGKRAARDGADSNPDNRFYLDESTGLLSRPGGKGNPSYSLTAVRTNRNSPDLATPAAATAPGGAPGPQRTP